MEFMLAIQTDTFPQTGLSYFAFRIAFQETLDGFAWPSKLAITPPTASAF